MPDARVGTTLAGKYRLIRLLGAGGMGAVYEAEHARTGRRVAVKLMLADQARDGELAARFLREARAASRVAHPNIVDVLDADEAPDGTLFIVQEFLVGHDLRRLLDERRALAPREAIEILAPVMSALVASHRAGVLHRDLKPENIFLSRSAGGAVVPKLIDFGISKLADGEGAVASMTRTGAAMGTPYYMSPEQARGERSLDAQADVWSMGVVLFETLAGRTPFVGDSYNQLLSQILMAPVPRLDEITRQVPRGLADVVAKALERDRERRFKRIANLLGALLDCDGIADASWRSTLKSRHGNEVSSPADDLDDGPTVAQRSPWEAPQIATAERPREISTTLGRSAREVSVPRRLVRAPVLAGLGAAVAIATVGAVLVNRARSPAEQAAARPAAAPIATQAMPVIPAAASSYVVSIIARPPGAMIDLDGAPTGVNELARTFPRDGTMHRLAVHAPGYSSATIEFLDAPPPSPVIELAPLRATGSRGGRVVRPVVGSAPAVGVPPEAPVAPPPAMRAATPTGANGAPIPEL